MSKPNLSKLHALIIGIDNYKDPRHQRLKGCVSDAASVFNYFTQDLGVPEDQLVRLCEGEATREGILNAFRDHLINNEKIDRLDPIVIYFAGYGGRHWAPAEWYSDDGKTESIFPYDVGSWETGYTFAIPDRTLGALIHQLHQAKGDNITVILDCCFSGSGTKGFIQGRSSDDPDAPPIPPTLDEDITGIQPQVPLAQTQHMNTVKQAAYRFSIPSGAPSLETHILLVACKNLERAQEVKDVNQPQDPSLSGLFTTGLLEALRDCDLATTSYAGLIRSIHRHISALVLQLSRMGRIDHQTPQCEGPKQDRLLFQTQFALCKGMIRLDHHPDNGTFHIKAGSASGIQLGAELDVHSESQPAPLARLVVTQLTTTTATLSLLDTGAIVNIPQDAYVVVAKYTGQAIRVLVKDDKNQLPSHWKDMFYQVKSLPIDIVWAKPGEPADIVLETVERGVMFHRQDPYIIQLEPRDIFLGYGLLANDLTHKLSGIAHFHFHLQRRNPNSPLQMLVGMRMIELKSKVDDAEGTKEYVPITDEPDDLFGDSLATGKTTQLKANPEKRYGLQLTNNSNWPLYAWVLYFDLEDYSISFMYTPPCQGTNPPLLTDGKELAVGYGSSGVEPLRVDNSGYSKRESGVFMLFVSNTWVDIEHMGQQSIFERVSEAKAKGRDEKKGTSVNPGDIWDVLLVGVSISE
ncbi:hypothetical protein FRC06_010754 [Ceratobasidium sp. 370]|nr:hypothetical protein FRC06_010754 [Ceratobasidium sp. 370]